jgi:uncharacterized protein with ParB-like and HNH nuclease domain
MSTGEGTIRTVITPHDKFLRQVFSVSKAYFIDIYQREYKWVKENVETLLKDIEVHFLQKTRTKTAPEEIVSEVQSQFEPYFLNTYLTHSTATNISIVDGQQRLTTLLLVLIKLRQMLKSIEEDGTYSGKTFSSQKFEELIFERGDFGGATRFKIFNENREWIFRKLIDGKEFEPKDETQKRLKENMEVISDYYDQFFKSENDSSKLDLVKLTYYISYLLDRISIVEIKIEKQKNVAMIFEVVNDRGMGLKPYEIIKGKLIGNLPETEKENANEIWTKLQNDYFNAVLKNSTESKLDLDSFFSTFFRAKFADSEKEYDRFEKEYHYVMYRDQRIRLYFKDFSDHNLLYKRITEDIKYFAELYLWLRTSYENDYLIYNKLLDQNLQYLLILSNISVNDPNKSKKVTEIARKFDQFHSILRLLDVYDSNAFQRMIFPINRDIRECELAKVRSVFDRELIDNLTGAELIQKDETESVSDIFTFEKFKGARNRWTNFSKYVLMRIDRYLAKLLDKPSYAAGSLDDLEDHFNKTTRKKYGMHLEHIYAFNNSNKELFTDEKGLFDEQAFKTTRNLLGMVLLLKDRQNESSNNEDYSKKFKRYSTSNFIWNELLVGHLDSVDDRDIPPEWWIESIEPDYNGAFPKSKVESRQRSIFAAIKTIWLDDVNREI